MMDEYLVESVARALVRLAVDAAGLDELLVPRQASSGENAGKPPAKRESKPPLSVSMVDLKMQTEQVVGKWCGALVRSCPELGPAPGRGGGALSVRADWLRSHLDRVAVMPWGQRCGEELLAQSRLVSDVVSPPGGQLEPMPPALTARQLARWCSMLGCPMSRSSIQRLASDGVVPSWSTTGGELLIDSEAVLALAREKFLVVGHPA